MKKRENRSGLNKMEKLDEIDSAIIRVMGNDARNGPKTIADKFDISASTVRRRVASLVKRGLMRVIGVCNPAKVGYSVCAVMAFCVANEHIDSFLEEMASHQEVRWLSRTTGHYDAFALVYMSSFEELSEFIIKRMGKPKGLREMETFMSLEVKKGLYVPIFMHRDRQGKVKTLK
jgi:Lrp/AsnC family transcriptional regulator for asnA, asnC and gidA